MKFFLAHLAPVKSGLTCVPVNIIPSGIRPCEEDANSSEVTELCDRLRKRLQMQTPSSSGSESSALLLLLEFWSSGELGTLGLRIISGPVTNALVEMLGQEFKIQVKVSNINSQGLRDPNEIQSPEMKFGQHGDYICKVDKFLTPRGMYLLEWWTVMVICNCKMRVYRKMLQGEMGSDVVIIPGKGNQVKAHKCVLMSHSSVFNSMFQSDKEKRRTVKMRELSEEGVRGLLAYLYCWDTIEPNAKAEVAVEMLYAGHKYDIPVLEAEMVKVLLSKSDKWYDVDVAVKLFLVGRNLSVDGEALKMKAIQVMKGNFGNFKKSPTYVALFKEDPEVAMEFCEYFAA